MNFIEGIIYMIWRGVAIGVIISAPMGPVGILCVQRTLEKGRRTGFFTGVGAAISDLFYCLLTGFGLSLIEDFLKANQNVIQIIGSIVLVLFGVYLFRSNPARSLKKPDATRTSRRRDVLQGFLFTVSNPLIIFLIIGLFARFNFLLPEINWIQYIIGYVSIISGALLWWWIVSFFVDKVRSHFNLRSMWLINRITGGIIMLFALVGIFTAVSNIASAAEPRVRYLNSVRGFGPLDAGQPQADKPLTIDNPTADTLFRTMPLGRHDDFSLSFRAANLHNKSGRKWEYRDLAGTRRKATFPAWGLTLHGEGHELTFWFKSADNGYDDLYSPTLRITARLDGNAVLEALLDRDIHFMDEWNSFRLVAEDGSLVLMGGSITSRPLMTLDQPPFRAENVGFAVTPGGALSVDYISLQTPDAPLPPLGRELSHFADPDVRHSYFMRSKDQLEGVWEIFDRTLDETCLRPGGNYRLAIVKQGGGYDLVYLSGASKNAAGWNPGTTKGSLIPTGHAGVYDVQWLDPAAVRIQGEIKAQFTAPDLLTLSFVDHDSQLRLRRISEKQR